MIRKIIISETFIQYFLQSKLMYPNGAKISASASKKLETISGDPNCDRTYVNTQFFVVFSEKYLKKQVKKGLSRKEMLSKFRDSNRYEVMKG